MPEKTKYIIIFSVLIIMLGSVGIFGWRYYKLQVDYLIPGVPYYGFYNHDFDAKSSIVAIPASILGYWGDERFNLVDLNKRLSKGGNDDYLFSNIRKFFEENGYQSYYWTSATSTDREIITKLKEFINPEKKIPVIILQRKSLDPSVINGYRLVIGIFDKNKKIIAHDYNFGNNYEISYENFVSMFNPSGQAILAVWPSENLLPKLKGPDYTKPYPERLPAMDSMGEMLTRVSNAVFFYNSKDYGKALPIYQEFVFGLPIHISLAPVIKIPSLQVLFDMAQLVDDVQIQEFVRGLTQMCQADGDGTVVVVYEHLMGHIHHKHLGFRNDYIDLFRVGKDGGQNAVGPDIPKKFRQTVLSGFNPAMDAKNIFHPDCITSWSTRFKPALAMACLTSYGTFTRGSISRTGSSVNKIPAAKRGAPCR